MPYQPKSEFLTVMLTRGFLQDCTDMEGLDEALLSGILPGYIGFDCTADSLHVGSLVQIMMLRWLQKCGHKPIILMGGGTTRVGDPSGKDEARQLLDDTQIAANMAGIRRVFDKYITFGEGKTGAIQPNNADWLDTLNYVAFLRDFGRHFTINKMVKLDSIKSRLDREQPLSFLEFNYMLLQAYDFMELNRRFGCRLQMGGSDQWGNIVNGVDLTRRINGAQVFGLTTPLLTKSDGSKMGKSAAGAVWLNAERLSAYEFWQFWRNTADADITKFLKLFTELPVEECTRLGALQGAEINAAKITLADKVTTLAHGADAAKTAAATAREVFKHHEPWAEAGDYKFTGGSVNLSHGLPTLELTAEDIAEGGISVVQLFVKSRLAASGKEAKRLIEEGGARIDNKPVTNKNLMIDAAMLAAPVKLSAGKKRHAMVQLEQ